MNYMIVGKNGSGKSYLCTSWLNDFDIRNAKRLLSNSEIYLKNYEILYDRDYDALFKEFSENLELLKEENVKVYSIFEVPQQLFESKSNFSNILDGIDFPDYFRFHIIYNNFIEFVNNKYSLKLETILSVHQLFADMNGLRIANVKTSPDDWREAPLGSIIFYDEFQDRPEYLFEGNKPSRNPMILELSKIRHYDIDIYLITPDSDNLHKSLRKIIHKMYFIKRPVNNPAACSVYTFDRFLSNPLAAAESKREPKKYVAYELVAYKKSIQALYTSAANHSSMRFTIPWKWVFAALGLIIFALLILTMLFKVPIFSMIWNSIASLGSKDNAVSQLSKPTLVPVAGVDGSKSEKVDIKFDLNTECRKAVNVEKQECVNWFNNLSNTKMSVDDNGVFKVVYDSNKPYDFEYVPENVEPTDFPRMSGVIKTRTGRLVAIDQQGNYMLKISEADCQRWLSGHRPFDYFAEKRQAVARSADVTQGTDPEPKQTEVLKKEAEGVSTTEQKEA